MSHIRDAFRLMKHRFWTISRSTLDHPGLYNNYFFRYYGALDLLFIAHFFLVMLEPIVTHSFVGLPSLAMNLAN